MTTFIQQVLNGLAVGSIYGFVAVGYSLIFGVLKVFNIAHGDIAIGAAYVGLIVVVETTVTSIWVIAPVVLLAGMALGALVDLICIKPVEDGPWSAPLLTTLGAAMVLAGAMRTYFGPSVRPFPVRLIGGSVEAFGVRLGNNYILILVAAVMLTVGLEVVLRRTFVGRWLRAVAQDPENAALLGIPVRYVRLGTVMVSSAFAAGAGLLFAVLLAGLTPHMGLGLAIKGIVVLIVGGMTSPRGAMIVGLALGMTESLTAAYLSSILRDLVGYLLLLVILMIRPSGLFSRERTLMSSRP